MPADYKTPPHGPSFTPITPPAHPASETKNNTSSTDPSHPPLEHDDEKRFRKHVSSIPFEDNDSMLSMFETPAPTEAQEENTLPEVVSEQAATATSVEEYMANAKRIKKNLDALVSLLRPRPKPGPDEDTSSS
jgi:hypothetical protein